MSSRNSLSVRFEDTCHLIPSSPPPLAAKTRLPKLVTRSISLPIWKTSPKSESPKPFSLTVPLPTLSIRSSPPRTTRQHPTASCLSTRPRGLSTSNIQSGPFPSASPKPRRLSFPEVVQHIPITSNSPTGHSSPSTVAATIPLRPCCEACYSRVDAALAQEHWTFKWSSAAARKHTEGLCDRTMVSSSIFPWKSHAHHDSSDGLTDGFVVLDEEGDSELVLKEQTHPSPF